VKRGQGVAPGKQCGPCTACCTVLAVDELTKPKGTPCPKLCAAGCGIYETRPTSCRGFFCLWLQGALDQDGPRPDWRPDRVGLVVDYQAESPVGDVMKVHEVRPGAAETPGALELLGFLVHAGFLVVLFGVDQSTPRRLLGPPGRLALAQAVLESIGKPVQMR
jgi:hypothetical protein